MAIRWEILAVILGTAFVTAVPRILPLVLFSRMRLPDWALDWLGFVPVTVLAALLARELLLPGGQLALPPDNLGLIAILPALVVGIRWRSLAGTVVTGAVAMAALRLLIP